MVSIQLAAILTVITFILVSLYGFYVLAVCENHALSHTLLGKGCPRANFLSHLSSWRQIFVSTIEEIALGFLVIALFFIPAKVRQLNPFLKSGHCISPVFLHYNSENLKPLHPLNKYIFSGKLHPQIYSR
jgi:hypothetical protein